jgi:hypothetical protein|tara:strand:- start:921 stop:1520 length:600 start_codon:yes stop_codon:yes gene_type:complete
MKKKCKRCGGYKPLSEFYKMKGPKLYLNVVRKDGVYHHCRECCREKARKYREKFREHDRKYHREYYAKNREKINDYYHEIKAPKDKVRRDRVKKTAFEVIADGKPIKCVQHKEWKCCVDPMNMDYLSLDHINGGGVRHYKEIGGGGSRVYKWIIKNPETAKKIFQIICMNAQWIKRKKNKEYTIGRKTEASVVRRGGYI